MDHQSSCGKLLLRNPIGEYKDVLAAANTYDQLKRDFVWNVPHQYNIGVDICDKWADGSAKSALVYETASGRIQCYSFDQMQLLANRTANLLDANGVRRVFSYGTARLDSIFEIGSVTKTFTGLILAQMIEQGKVQLDAAVRPQRTDGKR